jgi:Ca2+-binding RTX toxin-like protein
VVIENQFNSDVPSPPAARNHSQDTLTNALALYALFGAIDPAISADQISDLLRAASAQNNRTLENSLDSLRMIFGFGEATQTENMEAFYNNIYSLQTSPLFQSIANADTGLNATAGRIVSLVGMDPIQLSALAKSDFGYLFALKTLSPFAAIGAGNVFSVTQSETYELWQADRSLIAADRSSDLANFSDTYLRDRAQFLTWNNQKNVDDVADGASVRRRDNGFESILYTDKTLKNSQGQDYSLLVAGGNVVQQANPIRISFASDQGDTLSGGNYADHLYGGKGADTLAGGEGNDYLEGGAGADTLIGGMGDDTLIGGKGNDVLQGGEGDDVYIVRAGDGEDRILDHEGSNTIVYEDASGRRSVLGVAAFAVAGEANTWSGLLPNGDAVTLTQDTLLTIGLPGGATVAIEDFREGDCGIHLLASAQDPVATRNIFGDLATRYFPEPGPNLQYDDLNNLIVYDSQPDGGKGDHLWGSEGNDFIFTGTGNDVVFAKGGADRIVAGGYADYLDGGDGDDVIEARMDVSMDGSGGGDILVGGNGNDRLYAYEEVGLSEDVIAGPLLDETYQTYGAILIGGDGDDLLVGSDYWDTLFGGMGKDMLVGGAGNDFIGGDTRYEPSNDTQNEALPQRPSYPVSPVVYDTAEGDDDILFGGNGNDWLYGDGGDDWLSGGEGDDKLVGGIGSDTLFGDGGNDRLYAADQFDGYSSADYDVLDGGDGDDALFGGAGFNLMFGGAGNDYFRSGTGTTIAYGGDGNDTFYAAPSGYAEFYGEAGNDVLIGGQGESYLDGGEGDDLLWGGAGAEDLVGGPGNDTFIAFQNDVLEGGEGDDVYKFSLGAGENTVIDAVGANQIVFYSHEVPGDPEKLILRDRVGIALEGDQYRISYGDAGDSIVLGAAELATLPGLTLRHLTGYDYIPSDTEDGDEIQVERFTDEIIPFAQFNLRQPGAGEEDFLYVDAGTMPADPGSPPVDPGPPPAGAGGTAADAGPPPVDAGSPVADAGAPAADLGPTGAGAATPFDAGAASAGIGAVSGADNGESSGARQAGVTAGSSTEAQHPQAASPSQQEALIAAMRMLGAIESAAASAQSRTTSRPFDLLDAQSAVGQSAAASNPTPNALFAATQAAQPNLQTWLDSWLGPSARADNSAREPWNSMPPTGAGQPSAADPALGPGQPPSSQDFAPLNLEGEIPQTQPAEFLTPEQIGQSYEAIELWLAVNSGFEQGIAGASGALPERNLFAGIVTGSANETGTISTQGFGNSPGMAAIAGNTLQPLRGIKEGYTLLGVV